MTSPPVERRRSEGGPGRDVCRVGDARDRYRASLLPLSDRIPDVEGFIASAPLLRYPEPVTGVDERSTEPMLPEALGNRSPDLCDGIAVRELRRLLPADGGPEGMPLLMASTACGMPRYDDRERSLRLVSTGVRVVPPVGWIVCGVRSRVGEGRLVCGDGIEGRSPLPKLLRALDCASACA